MDSIKCPHCGKQVQLSDAIVHELQEDIRNQEKKRMTAEFQEQKATEKAKVEKELREEFEKKAKDKTEELEELKRKEKFLAEKLVQEQDERKKTEIKIRDEALKEASEKTRLEKLEYEIKISDMQKSLEEAQRKAKQGSQQSQGEVLELDLEEKLKHLFPNDNFTPIPKGVEGADIWQKIRFNGREVGSIIWETKRTKAWANSWTTKLKEDAARVSATEAILVTQVLPNGVQGFDRKDGVWITSYENAINICRFVRFLITSVNSAKSSTGHTEEEWTKIRDYMTSDSFKHRMQAHFDAVNSLRDSLEAEKRATTLRWKKQEGQINKLDMNTVNFYGELKSIVSNLPELTEIETPLLPDGDENDNETLF